MKWAHEQALPDSESKLLLLILANYAGHDNTCWPSVPRLAKECIFSESTARRRLQELEKLGFIRTKSRRDEAGDQTSNLYVLMIPPPVSVTPPPCQADTRGGVPVTPKPVSMNQSPNRGRPLSVLDLKDILKAKEERASELYRDASPAALSTHWTSDEKRQEWIKVRKEIKQTKDKIANYEHYQK
jgi:Helix-turn-helix domain